MYLDYEFTVVFNLKAPLEIGAGPFGVRRYYEVVGATVEGKRIKAKALTGGRDHPDSGKKLYFGHHVSPYLRSAMNA